MLNSAVGAYYYLRIIVVMYMREAREELPATPVSPALGAALAISVAATLYWDCFPDEFWNMLPARRRSFYIRFSRLRFVR